MRMGVRGFKRWLLPMLLVLTAAVLMGAGLQPTNLFYANDYANVLTDETEKLIVESSASLAQQTGAQIVVLTVDTLGGADAADYALKIGREWGIGDDEKNNGLLILLAVQDGEIRVEVGPGLEGALNDAKVGRLIDNYAIEHYQNGDFDTGTRELYNALLSQVMVEYGLEALPGYEPEQEDDEDIIFSVLFFIFIMVIVIIISTRRKPPRGGGTPPFIFYGGGFNNRGGFGGGFGGGSFGGGGGFSGGGFRGGGGSFGGGGAGRKF